jgi:hypothetical protein
MSRSRSGEALDRDRLAAVLALPIVPGGHTRERVIDRGDLGLRAVVEAGEQPADVLLLRLLVEPAEIGLEVVDLA